MEHFGDAERCLSQLCRDCSDERTKLCRKNHLGMSAVLLKKEDALDEKRRRAITGGHFRSIDRSINRSSASRPLVALSNGSEDQTTWPSQASTSGQDSSPPRHQPCFYQPLDPGKNEIRLLRLPPLQIGESKQLDAGALDTEIPYSLLQVNLEESPDYDALSYRWSTRNDGASITIGSSRVQISNTLLSALLELRVPGKYKLIWVDALCINQEDHKERNDQVSKMRTIYSKAKEVVAWLGEAISAEFDFSFIHRLHGRLDDALFFADVVSENSIFSQSKTREWRELVQILSHEYWKRIWIVQEVNSAVRLTLRCGRHTVDWQDFAAVQKRLSSCANVKTYDNGTYLNLWWTLANSGPKVLKLPDSDQDNMLPPLPELSRALIHFDSHLATDPRDMIYALIGLTSARDDPRLPIDYSLSVRDLYINLVEYVLQRESKLEVICAKSAPAADLPSWVPNWDSSYENLFRPFSSRPTGMRAFSASREVTAQASIDAHAGCLTAYGFCIDTLGVVGTHNSFGFQKYSLRQTILELLEYYQMMKSLSPEESEQKDEAFIQAILCDTDENNSALIRGILGVLLYYAPIYGVFGVVVPEYLQPLAYVHMPWAESWMRHIYDWLGGRDFFISKQGSMGICPQNHESDDIIVILLGCAVPVLLRPCKHGYNLIGDVYLSGYMYGAAMDELNRGSFKCKAFTIL